MKLLIIICCMASSLARGQQQIKMNFDKSKIYIAARGTLSKRNIISKEFNIGDTNITHIGVGYFSDKGKNLKLYGITTDSKTSNDLVVETVEEFKNKTDVFYIGIWSIDITRQQRRKFINLLREFGKKGFTFDYSIDLKNNDSLLYCSEFCWKILQLVDPKGFYYQPATKSIKNTLYGSVLKRDTLSYIPVDFFLHLKKPAVAYYKEQIPVQYYISN